MAFGYKVTFENITKIYPGCRALEDVSFEIESGEILALVGENGAGKSTLLNILHGVTKPDAGVVKLDGKAVEFVDAHDAICQGITKVHQEINLIPEMTIMQNLMLGMEETKGSLLNNRAMYARTRELMEQVHLDLDPKTKIRSLSAGQLQLLQIAKAINIEAKVISFDEPTASLSKSETQNLFEIIAKLKEKGVTIIYVSHRMDEIFKLANRCVILRDGRYIDTLVTAQTDKETLIRKMVGRDVGMFAKRGRPSRAQMDDTVLEVKGLTKYGVYEDISFQLHRGEILGFYGLVGAKRTEVMRALFGADPCDEGKILIHQKEVRINSPSDAIKLRIGLIPENRKTEGFIYEFSNAENIALTALDKFKKAGFINLKLILENCLKIGRNIRLKPQDPGFKTANLSGGNQQKVVLAKWLSANIDIMIFDEPTKGIDVGTKAEIYNLMEDLVEQGKSLILVSSEQPEAIGMSDRLLIMHNGRIAKELSRDEFDEQLIVIYALEGKADAE